LINTSSGSSNLFVVSLAIVFKNNISCIELEAGCLMQDLLPRALARGKNES